MKLYINSLVLVAVLCNNNSIDVDAFTTPQGSSKTTTTTTRIRSTILDEENTIVVNNNNNEEDLLEEQRREPNNAILPGRYDGITKCRAVPFLERSTALDGAHAGDLGFDPLGFAEDSNRFVFLQECEVKHARLAMLAVLGWPAAELFSPVKLLLSGDNRLAPSVLNGFDNPITLVSLAGIFIAFGRYEYERFKEVGFRSDYTTELGKRHREDMSNIWNYGAAGDYNFDPLDLYGELYGNTPEGRRSVRDAELANGRAAMMAITGIAISEYITKQPITESFDGIFFHPNYVLPSLAAVYWSISQFYEITPPTQYPVRIQRKTKSKKSFQERISSGAKFAATTITAPVRATAYVSKKYRLAEKFKNIPKGIVDFVKNSYEYW